jgi:hypothetical protein
VSPSVSVTEGEDGQALVCCHAGCRTEDIVADWGLEMSDLFEQRNGDKQEFRSIPREQLQPRNHAPLRTTLKSRACLSHS